MVKKVIIEMSKNEYDSWSDNVEDIITDINDDFGSMLNTIAEIEDPGIKIGLTHSVKSIKENVRKLKNGYVIYRD
jgi:archaellum component FlaC